LWEACWINSKTFDQYVDELKNKPNDTFALMSRGKAYLIAGRYKEACEDLTGLIGFRKGEKGEDEKDGEDENEEGEKEEEIINLKK
ncbi:23375_t:CDS:1, partial [Dentiscutata erythropus]